MNEKIIYIICYVLYTLKITTAEKINPLSDLFIDIVNTQQSLWRAGRNFPLHLNINNIKKMMGTIKDTDISNLEYVQHDLELMSYIPKYFDSREKWSHCKSIKEIRDQGSCAASWAFAAVEAMSDRYCIFSEGREQFYISAQDLLSCCPVCGFGCDGGKPYLAWLYWTHFGIVTGGNYNSSLGCVPYEIPPCDSDDSKSAMPCTGITDTPNCYRKCQASYNTEYLKDKKYGKMAYAVMNDEDQIRIEILLHGPVEATMTVYSDFLTYKSGIYKHSLGEPLGDHSVKIIGWGIQNGRKYWLVANSWSARWGDHGFFKIIRGINNCAIESTVVAGKPAF